MEINVNFVLFEELQDKPHNAGALARIVVVREGDDPIQGLEDGPASFFPPE